MAPLEEAEGRLSPQKRPRAALGAAALKAQLEANKQAAYARDQAVASSMPDGPGWQGAGHTLTPWADEAPEGVHGARDALAVRHLRFRELESGHISVRAETPPGTRWAYREQVVEERFPFRGTRYTRSSVAARTAGGLLRNAVSKGAWVLAGAVALGQNLWMFGTDPSKGETLLDRTVKNREFWVSTGVDFGISILVGVAAAGVVAGALLGLAALGVTAAATAPLWLTVGLTAAAGIGIGLGVEALGIPRGVRNWANSVAGEA